MLSILCLPLFSSTSRLSHLIIVLFTLSSSSNKSCELPIMVAQWSSGSRSWGFQFESSSANHPVVKMDALQKGATESSLRVTTYQHNNSCKILAKGFVSSLCMCYKWVFWLWVFAIVSDDKQRISSHTCYYNEHLRNHKEASFKNSFKETLQVLFPLHRLLLERSSLTQLGRI